LKKIKAFSRQKSRTNLSKFRLNMLEQRNLRIFCTNSKMTSLKPKVKAKSRGSKSLRKIQLTCTKIEKTVTKAKLSLRLAK
jgi:hypothetical protein